MRIPAAPLLFGLLLAVPFLWGAATLLSGDLARWGTARIGAPYVGPNLQLFLAPVVLPFMAGALWGLAARTSGARALVAMLLAAAPALWVFLMGGGGAARGQPDLRLCRGSAARCRLFALGARAALVAGAAALDQSLGDRRAGAGGRVTTMPAAPRILAYTDGACSGNPGPGGWGALLCAMRGEDTLRRRELKGGEAETTNNRMELMAAIMALETLTRPSAITIVTDSQYVKNGVTSWIHGWKRNGWKTAARKPVKNAELWQRLDLAQGRHEVRWEWVKGHAGHPENERADELAREGMQPFRQPRRREG